MASLTHPWRYRAGQVPLSTEVPEISWRFILVATTAVVATATALNISFRGRGFYSTVYAETGHLVPPSR